MSKALLSAGKVIVAAFLAAAFSFSFYLSTVNYGQALYLKGEKEGIEKFISELDRRGFSCRKAQHGGVALETFMDTRHPN